MDLTCEQWAIMLLMIRKEIPQLPQILWSSVEMVECAIEKAMDDSVQDVLQEDLKNIINDKKEEEKMNDEYSLEKLISSAFKYVKR